MNADRIKAAIGELLDAQVALNNAPEPIPGHSAAYSMAFLSSADVHGAAAYGHIVKALEILFAETGTPIKIGG